MQTCSLLHTRKATTMINLANAHKLHAWLLEQQRDGATVARIETILEILGAEQ